MWAIARYFSSPAPPLGKGTTHLARADGHKPDVCLSMVGGADGALEGCHVARAEKESDSRLGPAGLTRRQWAGDAKRVTLDESGQQLFMEVQHSIVVKLQHHRALD
jgi:hypothetical protein